MSLGRWLADADRDWPEAALAAARNAFVDTVGVAVAGAPEAPVRRLLSVLASWGAGPSATFGGPRLAAPWAALVNGAAAHALDFDDLFEPAKAHAGAVLVPAILALGEQEGAGGRDCLDAFVAGLQVMGRVGEGLNPVHRFRGWHATGTIGAIGAAAASARLLRLDARQASHALSIATSLAGGFMSQFGSAMKPIHAGLAARAGVIAASLARNGVDAGAETLLGPTGMTGLMVGPDHAALSERMSVEAGRPVLAFRTERVGEPLFILSAGLKVKRFPNCASAHRAMDAFIDIAQRRPLAAAQIEEIIVHAPAAHLANLAFTAPITPAEARFSLEHALALLAVDGRCGNEGFGPEALARPEIRAFYPRISRRPFDAPDGSLPTQVELRLVDGAVERASVLMAKGSKAAPFSPAQMWEKFRTCVEGAGEERAARLRLALERLDSLERLTELTDLFAGGRAPLRPSAAGAGE